MNENKKCDFCGRIPPDPFEAWGDGNGHIFCDKPCSYRFEMGNNDKCAYCGKKIFGSVLKAKDVDNGNYFYFCYESCFNKYKKKRTDKKLERVGSLAGGYWAQI